MIIYLLAVWSWIIYLCLWALLFLPINSKNSSYIRMLWWICENIVIYLLQLQCSQFRLSSGHIFSSFFASPLHFPNSCSSLSNLIMPHCFQESFPEIPAQVEELFSCTFIYPPVYIVIILCYFVKTYICFASQIILYGS